MSVLSNPSGSSSPTPSHLLYSSAVNRTAGGRVFNFNAGPSVLPEEVIRQIQDDVWDFAGTGFGILEHSHRAKPYDKLLAETFAVLREVGRVPADFEIVMMTGGSSSQNYIVPLNLLPAGRTADYIETDFWSVRSIEDGRQAGHSVHSAWSGKAHEYRRLPAQSELQFSANPAYVHITSNNTIYGTQMQTEPQIPSGAVLVCDGCSDILSKPIAWEKYGLIYASAQKNIGTTGVTVVFVRKDLLERAGPTVPRMLQYRNMVKEDSRPNTPPHFAIYTVKLMADWIKRNGGLDGMHARNIAKAKVVYDALDACPGFYSPHAARADRSLMNVCFRLPTVELEERFLAESVASGMDGMRGHRATGGMRASIYNAFPYEGCVLLAQFLVEFARRNG